MPPSSPPARTGKPLVLAQRRELRLALTAGLMNGLALLSAVPYGYYATLAVLSSMGTSYGSTLELGRQRVLGTLLGALMVLICQEGLRGVPLPLALAIALGGQRLLGGLLGLQVGYKVGGIVIVMGWLVHSEQFAVWLPLRLFWTVVGVIVGLLSMRLFWPSSAVADGWTAWSQLLGGLAEALGRQAPLAATAPADGLVSMAPLRARLIALRSGLPAIRGELGGATGDHPVLTLLACLDDSGSRLIGLLSGFQRLPPHGPSDALQAVRQGEIALLRAVAARVQLWAQALALPAGRSRYRLPRAPMPPFDPDETWGPMERLLDDPRLNRSDLITLERVAVRLQLCRQLLDALERTERLWRRCSS